MSAVSAGWAKLDPKRRKAIAVGGGAAAVAVLLALRSRARAASVSGGSQTGQASAAANAAGGRGSVPITAGLSGTPDTLGTDLGNQIQDLRNLITDKPSVTPAPEFVPTFDPTNKNIIRNSSTGAVWQVQDGGRYHVDPAELASIGGFDAALAAPQYGDPNEDYKVGYVPFSRSSTT